MLFLTWNIVGLGLNCVAKGGTKILVQSQGRSRTARDTGKASDAGGKHRRILVFSAHAANFCSRSGGTIALYASADVQVHVVALTFGERGESEDYWRKGGPRSLAEVKKV